MKKAFCFLADILDTAAGLAALASAVFFVWNLNLLRSGPDLMFATCVFCLTLAIVPYCLASAAHRISDRLNN